MKIVIENAKKFIQLTAQEQKYEIAKAVAKEECIENWGMEYFNDWKNDGYGSSDMVANCGCNNIYWSATQDAQTQMNICFGNSGEVGSDMWELLTLDEMTCLNCGKKPQMPEWYLEEQMPCAECWTEKGEIVTCCDGGCKKTEAVSA